MCGRNVCMRATCRSSQLHHGCRVTQAKPRLIGAEWYPQLAVSCQPRPGLMPARPVPLPLSCGAVVDSRSGHKLLFIAHCPDWSRGEIPQPWPLPCRCPQTLAAVLALECCPTLTGPGCSCSIQPLQRRRWGCMASGPSGAPLQKTASVGPGWGTSQSLKVGLGVSAQAALLCAAVCGYCRAVCHGTSADWLHHMLA